MFFKGVYRLIVYIISNLVNCSYKNIKICFSFPEANINKIQVEVHSIVDFFDLKILWGSLDILKSSYISVYKKDKDILRLIFPS